jgi:hypothetical protein
MSADISLWPHFTRPQNPMSARLKRFPGTRGNGMPPSLTDDSFGSLPSSPLEREDSVARFLFFTKIELAARGGGDFFQRVQRLDTPHPGPPPQGGREGDTRELCSTKGSTDKLAGITPTLSGRAPS